MEDYKKEINTILKKVAASGGALLHEFLDDLLTISEYEEIARRWQIVKMLNSGMSQREIAEKLGVGVATVTRGAKELADKKGGFRKVITKFGAK